MANTRRRRRGCALTLARLFLLVRSGFIVLTHMMVPAGAVSVSAGGVLSVLA